jgi:hypothetical protein
VERILRSLKKRGNSMPAGFESASKPRKVPQRTMEDDKATSTSKKSNNQSNEYLGVRKSLKPDLDQERKDSDDDDTTSFLRSPEVLWQESPTEKVLTYVGNGPSCNHEARLRDS